MLKEKWTEEIIKMKNRNQQTEWLEKEKKIQAKLFLRALKGRRKKNYWSAKFGFFADT